jgi:hypothetical protein
LKWTEAKLRQLVDQGKRDDIDMLFPYRTRGAGYLNVVGQKHDPDRGVEVYGAENSAALAKWQGPLKTGLKNPPGGGGYLGEFGTILNGW